MSRGSRLVVCFHGYDEDGGNFQMLRDLLPGDCSILAMDLPFHGKTIWSENDRLDVEGMHELIERIRQRHFREADTLEFFGFSMGGRVALAMVEQTVEKAGYLTLLAPDGLVVNPWYWLATQTRPGHWLFRFTVQYPGWFFMILKLAKTLRLVNLSIYKFTMHHLGTETQRWQLYNRWISMRWFRPRLSAVRERIITDKIPVLLLYGSYDRIMPASRGKQFCHNLGELCQVKVMATGHLLLQPKNKKHLVEIFRNRMPGRP